MYTTILIGAAFVLALVSLIQSKGQSLVSWAVVLLSAALLLPLLLL